MRSHFLRRCSSHGSSSRVHPSRGFCSGFGAALAEKAAAVTTWQRLRASAANLSAWVPDGAASGPLVAWRRQLETGTLYGELLSSIIEAGWRALAHAGGHGGGGSATNWTAVSLAVADYDAGWAAYNGFRISNPYGATLYKVKHPLLRYESCDDVSVFLVPTELIA